MNRVGEVAFDTMTLPMTSEVSVEINLSLSSSIDSAIWVQNPPPIGQHQISGPSEDALNFTSEQIVLRDLVRAL